MSMQDLVPTSRAHWGLPPQQVFSARPFKLGIDEVLQCGKLTSNQMIVEDIRRLFFDSSRNYPPKHTDARKTTQLMFC